MNKKLILILSVQILAVFYIFASPSRIVSLAPNGTEILYELGCGSAIVARTDFCDYPSEVLQLPSVGGFDGKSFSIETILAYNPDFVYMVDGMHNHLEDLLKQFHVPYYLSKATSIDAVFDEIADVARIMECPEKGEKLISKMKTELDSIKRNPEKRPSVYCEIFASPYMSIGEPSFMNDILEFAGARNIFGDLAQSYPQVSEEAIIAKNPDFIIVPYYSPDQIKLIYRRRGWNKISAVKNRKIYAIDADIFSRPGPRVVDAIKMVQEIVWSEAKQ
ncbi:MAG: cobalamin-binding protein [Treponemataceae bacterium]|nr:cobalamin-binding protein [Treponemataceae bacterium]